MAAGVAPQSSWSFRPQAPASICSTRPAAVLALPLPKKPRLTGKESAACSIRPRCQGPGVHVVAVVPAAGPVPPPIMVVMPENNASSICCGHMKWICVSIPPAVTRFPSPAITSVPGPMMMSISGCKLNLLAIRRKILFNLDHKICVGEAHFVTHGWPKHLRVGAATHFARHAHLPLFPSFIPAIRRATGPLLLDGIHRPASRRRKVPRTPRAIGPARIALLFLQVCRGDTQAQPVDQTTRRYLFLQSDSGCRLVLVDRPCSRSSKKLPRS